MKVDLEKLISEFIGTNPAEYYMIRNYPDYISYCTLLKVEDVNYAKNIASFIEEHIGVVTQASANQGYRFDFCVDGGTYSLFNYDAGLVKV